MSVDDLNNFFVNLGYEATKHIKPNNDVTFRINHNINSFFVNPVTNQEILYVVENL
jgi:hypothetical protein